MTLVKDAGAGLSHDRAMTAPLTRRRFLLAGTAGCLAAGTGADTGAETGPAGARAGTLRWRGTAFGADALVILPDLPGASAALVAVAAELGRIEGVFSLFRAGSQLCRLNAAGHLDRPDPDLVAVLRLAARVHATTGGAFDPTVQPLWAAHAAAAAAGRAPDARDLARLCGDGWQHVAIRPDRVALGRPGMALTLNGIAQGHAADRIARLLRRRGFRDVLVDAGEIAARGRRPGGVPWHIDIAAADGRVLRRTALADRALATSDSAATVLDPAGRVGHILDPRTGRPAGRRTVAVSAPSAALADALSTAFCVMDPDRARAAAAAFPGAVIESLQS